jgi:hypothetical protein
LIYSLKPKSASSSAIVADLPPGIYLIAVGIQRGGPDEAGEILATPGRYFFWRDGYVGFSVPSALYWREQSQISMLVDHLGGPLYISRFENAPARPNATVPDLNATFFGNRKGPKGPAVGTFLGQTGIRVISVRRVLPLLDKTERLKPVEIPPLLAWTRQDSTVSIKDAERGSIRITGTVPPEKWLLQSAPIGLEGNERFTLALPTSPSQGALEVGVLDSNGSWLASPTVMPRRVVFETRRKTSATIVVTNSSLGESVPLDVTISPGTLVPVFPKELYVDQLMARRRYGLKPAKPR